MKSKKSALLMSFTSLLLCFAMLAGSTFAWFTDTATTGVNKIVAGKLDVELLMYDGTKYANISKNPAPIFGSGTSTVAQNNNLDTLWEPSKTQVAYLAIKNEGNLDLKYQVALNVINPADGKDLYQVMQYAIVPDKRGTDPVPAWTTGKTVTPGAQIVSGTNTTDANPAGVKLLHGETHYFALLVHMDENAGNAYQNGKVEFDLTVYATQLNSENDSFNNEYDKNAEYDKGDAPPADAKKVATAAELKNAITSAEDGDYILLTNDIDLTSALTVAKAITLDLNGKTLNAIGSSYNAKNTIKLNGGADLTVKDTAEGGKITNSYNGSADPATIDLQGTDAVFTLESGVVESNAKDNLYTIAISNSKKKACTVNINGGTVSNPDGHVKSRAISASSGMTLNISGGAVAGGLYGLDLYAGSNTTITGGSVTANAFDGRTDEYGKQYGVHMKGEAALTVGSLDVESVPVVQGIKFESSGVKTELPTIKLVKGNMTSPIYSMEAKYNYPLFKLGIVADAPVTFVDDTAKHFLPDGLKITGNNGVYTVTAE